MGTEAGGIAFFGGNILNPGQHTESPMTDLMNTPLMSKLNEMLVGRD